MEQIKYLLMNRFYTDHVDHPDMFRGKFMLGRATGHTTSVIEVTKQLSHQNVTSMVVLPNQQIAQYFTRECGGKDCPAVIVSIEHLFRHLTEVGVHRKLPEVFIFDTFSYTISKLGISKYNQLISELYQLYQGRKLPPPVIFEVQ